MYQPNNSSNSLHSVIKTITNSFFTQVKSYKLLPDKTLIIKHFKLIYISSHTNRALMTDLYYTGVPGCPNLVNTTIHNGLCDLLLANQIHGFITQV